MLKSFKYRLYPTDKQWELIDKNIGASRFLYNLALETKIYAYKAHRKSIGFFDLSKQLPELKKECLWLRDVDSKNLQNTLSNLDKAFLSFFNNESSFPRFKKKKARGSYTTTDGKIIKVCNTHLFIPKFREGIRINLHAAFTGKIKQCTISRTTTGKYFASILVDTGEVAPDKATISPETTVGVDLGLKTFLVASDGQSFDNPKFFRKSLSKLKYIQRKYSKHKGKRTKHKLAVVHEKVSNQRKDFLHKTSTKLIRENQTICIEDLNVSGMVKNHKLALSISDAGWGEFRRQLEYKADWYGKNILKIGRFEPSSKTCSACGTVNHELILSDREWTCSCGITHDRDLNAAINIKNFALKNLSIGSRLKSHGELPTLVGALTHEGHLG